MTLSLVSISPFSVELKNFDPCFHSASAFSAQALLGSTKCKYAFQHNHPASLFGLKKMMGSRNNDECHIKCKSDFGAAKKVCNAEKEKYIKGEYKACVHTAKQGKKECKQQCPPPAEGRGRTLPADPVIAGILGRIVNRARGNAFL
jgi:hypothetical protein